MNSLQKAHILQVFASSELTHKHQLYSMAAHLHLNPKILASQTSGAYDADSSS